jgi:hypothetical protein
MDSFEFNKIAAAFLTTALVFIGIKELGDAIYHVEKPKKSAYIVEGVAETNSAAKVEKKSRRTTCSHNSTISICFD